MNVVGRRSAGYSSGATKLVRRTSPVILLCLILVGCGGESADAPAEPEPGPDKMAQAPPPLDAVEGGDSQPLLDKPLDDAFPPVLNPYDLVEPSELQTVPLPQMEFRRSQAAPRVEMAAPRVDNAAPVQMPLQMAAQPEQAAEPEQPAQAAPSEAIATGSPNPAAGNPSGTDSAAVEPAVGPAGATIDRDAGYLTVPVFYATDRLSDPVGLSQYRITGNRKSFYTVLIASIVFAVLAIGQWLRRNLFAAGVMGLFGAASVLICGIILAAGSTHLQKHGVNYGVSRGSFVRGISRVTVPLERERGDVPRPSVFRFEFAEDQRKHVVLRSAVELDQDQFQSQLADTVASANQPEAMVFVHGYNVTFESAVQRTAQLAVDLPFDGVAVCYSWPSQGSLSGYTIDETNARWTATHLKQFLLELAQVNGVQKVNVIAHSMGNRPTTAVLKEIASDLRLDSASLAASADAAVAPRKAPAMVPGGASFGQVVFAAPDVDADVFRRDLAPALIPLADRVTLYASSDDQALVASKKVHGYARAGEGGAEITVVPGVETIDVTGIDLSLLGHSYYGDHPQILNDLYHVMTHPLPVDRRRALIATQAGPGKSYWKMQLGRPLQTARAVDQ